MLSAFTFQYIYIYIYLHISNSLNIKGGPRLEQVDLGDFLVAMTVTVDLRPCCFYRS